METYQAVYDAVRSRISNGDIGNAIENVLRAENFGHYIHMAMVNVEANAVAVAEDMTRPHVLMRPRLSIDGDQWCALYGENLQDGVAGFGKSPALAMKDFDTNWKKTKD